MTTKLSTCIGLPMSVSCLVYTNDTKLSTCIGLPVSVSCLVYTNDTKLSTCIGLPMSVSCIVYTNDTKLSTCIGLPISVSCLVYTNDHKIVYLYRSTSFSELPSVYKRQQNCLLVKSVLKGGASLCRFGLTLT